MANSPRDEKLAEEARALILEGIGKWVDQWDWVAGSAVTGWVVVVETMRPDGGLDVTWTQGDGSPTANAGGGLAYHRADALVRHVSRSIDTHLIARNLRDDE